MSRSNMKPCMLVMVLASAGLITACGGGGGGVETGNGGVATTTNSTATTVSGTISGLGSVIVNGIRYETIGAAVRDMDDNRVISRPLGLGMTVKLEPSTTRAAVAGMIHVLSGIKGGISATNSAAKTLNVAGLPVTTDATTLHTRHGTVCAKRITNDLQIVIEQHFGERLGFTQEAVFQRKGVVVEGFVGSHIMRFRVFLAQHLAELILRDELANLCLYILGVAGEVFQDRHVSFRRWVPAPCAATCRCREFLPWRWCVRKNTDAIAAGSLALAATRRSAAQSRRG